ncbi:60S acidic ribosomal protein P0 [Cucumispora dikerogammari]|nr:60S acidic ribosomal protein P0 [Cucumispora dikerogammari]
MSLTATIPRNITPTSNPLNIHVPKNEKTKDTKKQKIYKKTKHLFSTYSNFLILDMTKISSFQFQFIKHQLPSGCEILFGKNTTISFILKEMSLDHIAEKCIGNIAILFCKTPDLFQQIRLIFSLNKRQSHAKVGDIAQGDLFLEPYNTGMPPSMTEFFQALELQTKIEKGTVALISRSQILFKDKKVLPSQANLLKFLNSKPFIYELNILWVYENKTFFKGDYLYIDDEYVLSGIQDSVKALVELSIGLELVNESTVRYEVLKGVAAVKAVGLGLGVDIKW